MDFNVWLLIVDIIMLALLAAASFFFILYYQDTYDKEGAVMYKIVAMICFTIAMFTPVLFPTDIANIKLGGSPVVLGYIFEILPLVEMILTFIVIPFFYSLYSTVLVKKQCSYCRIWKSMWKALLVLVIFLCLAIILYFFIGFAEIPITTVSAAAESVTNVSADGLPLIKPDEVITYEREEGIRELQMTVTVYIIGVVELVGYAMLLVFMGVGLASLPLSMIRKFIKRPKSMKEAEYTKRKKAVTSRADKLQKQLMDLKMKGPSSKNYNKEMIKLKREVYKLEDDWRVLVIVSGHEKSNPLKYIGLLIAGILLLLVSIVIVVHIILSPLLDVHPFLNDFLLILTDVWDFLSIIVFGALAIYMMFAAFMGIAYFGFRFILFIPIHPMRRSDTSMAGILFNIALLMLSALGILPLLQQLFTIASEGGGSAMIYEQTTNMKYLGYIYKYGLWVIVALFPISIIVILFIPGKSALDRAKEKADKVSLRDRATGNTMDAALITNAEIDLSD